MKGRPLLGMAGAMFLLLDVMMRAQGPLQAVRAIDDPATGTRWLLVRSADHPGGPGRLMRADAEPVSARSAAIVAPPAIVLRGGDRLIVIEETPVAEADLNAVALGPASVGAVCEARLQVTDRTVRVIVLGPGRARLAPADFREVGEP